MKHKTYIYKGIKVRLEFQRFNDDMKVFIYRLDNMERKGALMCSVWTRLDIAGFQATI